ncbi:DEAD/DEAH box helicase [Roseovarius sp.]|uniref:DEAD/DEAH box helicase n=1 Tax=Roseovarius sp. TaxID=1486281 RepID=UPI0026281F79|nr:DEAD/DEAH box helicase [Roseovarius sp.]MDM8167106.1 DEAD/DEAH box helicase [Roseovarius sp.]
MIQSLSDALAERGYDILTPVQEAVTAPELAGADLLVSAQTGSGKTVGFGLAIGPTLLDEAGVFGPAAAPLGLIIAPTRELALQVTRELGWLYAKAGARIASCVGGMDMRDERRALERGAHIVVGTPGRLSDHIRRGSLDMSALRAVVLDEADEMLDLGFREDLEFMLGEAPEERRTLLFSATVPPMIVTLAKHYQRDAVRVTTLSDKSPHADITYQALRVAPQDAENAIINVLRFHEAQNAIVFANTRATVNRLTARFANRGFSVVCLSGELSQAERSHALQAMRDGRARVCVATDVAARGIDLPNLELVVHAELPSNSETLLHRSGRTGRAGRKGISALIVPPKVGKKAERLLKGAKVQAEWTVPPGAEEILRRDEERLLADPVWGEAASEAEAEFAARLLAEQSPEAVAAAYLRLFRARHSVPEELSDVASRPEPKPRPEFGPSVWVSLSVGRDKGAEPRWLLPLMLRAGALEKADVGAIRVQDTETFVEIAEGAAENFMASLEQGGVLEKGVSVRAVEGVPEFGRPEQSERPARPAGGAPKRGGGKPWQEKKDTRPRGPKPERRETAERAERGPRPERKAEAPREKPGKAFERAAPGGKPKKPYEPRRPKPAAEAGAPAPQDTRKPRSKGPKAGKPAGKPVGKPDAKVGAGKPKPRVNASDTSKRFTPPGKPGKPAKPRGGVRGKGGSAVPKRRKP